MTDVVVTPTGAGSTGGVTTPLVWGVVSSTGGVWGEEIDNDQTPDWTEISTTQTPAWTQITN